MSRLPAPNVCGQCALPFARDGTEHHPDGLTMLLKAREKPASSRSRLVCGPCTRAPDSSDTRRLLAALGCAMRVEAAGVQKTKTTKTAATIKTAKITVGSVVKKKRPPLFAACAAAAAVSAPAPLVPPPVRVTVPQPAQCAHPPAFVSWAQTRAEKQDEQQAAVAVAEVADDDADCPSSPMMPERKLTRIELHYLDLLDEPLDDCERENKCGKGVCTHDPADLRYRMNAF